MDWTLFSCSKSSKGEKKVTVTIAHRGLLHMEQDLQEGATGLLGVPVAGRPLDFPRIVQLFGL